MLVFGGTFVHIREMTMPWAKQIESVQGMAQLHPIPTEESAVKHFASTLFRRTSTKEMMLFVIFIWIFYLELFGRKIEPHRAKQRVVVVRATKISS